MTPLCEMVSTATKPDVEACPKDSVPSQARDSEKPHLPTLLLGIPLLLLTVYVLSIGPVAKYHENRPFHPAWKKFYAPLLGTMARSRTVHAVMSFYVEDIWAAGFPSRR